MKLNKLLLGCAAVVLLTGCSSMKKVSYEKFHEQAVTAHEKGNEYKTASVSGTIKSESSTTKIDKMTFTHTSLGWVADEISASSIVVGAVISVEAYALSESDDATYYAGGGFKVENKETKDVAVYNAAGLITSMSGDGYKYTVKYSK